MKQLLAMTVFFGVLSLLFLHPVNSGDFFHHIATGRDIITTRALPMTDTWTFTAFGRPWVAYSWGAGVLFYLLYRSFGYEGISVLFALLGAGTGLFLFLALKNVKIPIPLRVILVFFVSSMISLRWPTRPEVLGPLFISVLLFFLTSFRGRWARWSLPLIFWLWAMLYGSSVFLGIIILALYLITAKQLNGRSAVIFFVSLFAGLGNGYGWRSFFYIFSIPKIAANVGEWLPLTSALNPQNPGVALFYQYPVLVYGLFVLLFGVTVIVSLKKSTRIVRTYGFFSVLSLAILAPLFAVRFMNLSPILSLPFFAVCLHALGKKTQRIVTILLLTLALFASFTQFKTFHFGLGLEEHSFPTSSVGFLKEHAVSGNIFSSQEAGGFLAWQLPDSKIFVDTRDDLYLSTDVFKDLSLVNGGGMDILRLLSKYKATIVVGDVSFEAYRPLFYQNNWALVSLANSSFVAVRTELVKRYGLTTLAALDPTRVPPVKPGMLEQARVELASMRWQPYWTGPVKTGITYVASFLQVDPNPSQMFSQIITSM